MKKVPVLHIAGRAYHDAFRAVLAMPTVAALAILMCLVDVVVTEVVQLGAPLVQLAGRFAVSVMVTFMVTPFLIAVHRYILLGEVTTRYRLDVRSRRFRRFFGYSLLLLVIWEGGVATATIWGAEEILSAAVVILAVVVVVVLSVKIILLFPAIALDAPEAQWRNALRGSRGSFWRIFFVCFFALLPVLAPVLTEIATSTMGNQRTMIVMTTFGTFVSESILVAAASHLFRILDHKMRGDLGAVPAAVSDA